MSLNSKKRIIYLIGFVLLMCIETIIALYVHDNFIRPYIGDIIVVFVVYCFIRIFIPEGIKYMPVFVFIFATTVELLQYLNLAQMLGLENNRIARIVIGYTFDIRDIVCYLIGCVLLTFLSTSIIKKKVYNFIE
jgi:hypothetical protein